VALIAESNAVKINDHLYLVGSEQFAISHPLDCNCYLLDGRSALALIDTGTGMGATQIIANLKHHGFEPKRLTHIIITHAHLGHWGASAELRKRTGAKVWAPRARARLMLHPEEDCTITQNFKFGRYPKGFKPQPCKPDKLFGDDNLITIGELQVRTILTRGHTKDSTCFYYERKGKRGLFTGDVVFYGGKVGFVNAEGCDLSDYRTDIKKLAKLRVDFLLPGHSVFVLSSGQKHIDRAIQKLSDFVMPETFFETNEFVWERDYLAAMREQGK